MKIKLKANVAVCPECAALLIAENGELRCEDGHELKPKDWGNPDVDRAVEASKEPNENARPPASR